MNSVAPFALFYAGALFVPLVQGRLRQVVMLGIPLLGIVNLLAGAAPASWELAIFDYVLIPYRVDRLSLLFGYLFHLAAFLSILFVLHVRDTGQQVAGLCYVGSALGAVFAGDLITLFMFWELMAVSSAFLIWARGTRRAMAAGFRYLIIQILSGVCLLAGALVHHHETGSIAFDYIGLDGLASWLILLAFGIKSGFPLLHNWLTDAYPEATPTGTVFLCAFTTKTAVYALARGFPGTELLVFLGATMTCFPIFYAVIENDLRRVLSYSMINQLGFMVCGIGIGSTLAVNGAVAHVFTHVIYKQLLFMSMGAVLHMTGRINGSDLGGLYKSMPITTVLCLVGAASISAFPLFSGFVSKSMVMAAALQEGYPWVWLVLLFASAAVFHHAGIKVPFFAFFAHDSGLRTSEPPGNMLAAMVVAAGLCVFIGCYPWWLYRLLPHFVDYTPFDPTHIIAQMQLLCFSALAFVWLKLSGLYPPELPSVNIDVEWIYRRFAPRLADKMMSLSQTLDHRLKEALELLAAGVLDRLYRYYGPHGILARTWPTGRIVLSVTAVLAACLLYYYAMA